MTELLAAALRMMAPADPAPGAWSTDGFTALPPASGSYADAVRRFEPVAAPWTGAARASAIEQLVRIHHTLATLNGFAREHGVGAAAPASDHLYQAHGDPRD